MVSISESLRNPLEVPRRNYDEVQDPMLRGQLEIIDKNVSLYKWPLATSGLPFKLLALVLKEGEDKIARFAKRDVLIPGVIARVRKKGMNGYPSEVLDKDGFLALTALCSTFIRDIPPGTSYVTYARDHMADIIAKTKERLGDDPLAKRILSLESDRVSSKRQPRSETTLFLREDPRISKAPVDRFLVTKTPEENPYFPFWKEGLLKKIPPFNPLDLDVLREWNAEKIQYVLANDFKGLQIDKVSYASIPAKVQQMLAVLWIFIDNDQRMQRAAVFNEGDVLTNKKASDLLNTALYYLKQSVKTPKPLVTLEDLFRKIEESIEALRKKAR